MITEWWWWWGEKYCFIVFCFFILFSVCVSHVVTCRCSHFGNPTVYSLHVYYCCCTVALSPLSPFSLHTRLDLWYKLFWYHFVQSKKEWTPWRGISAVAMTVKVFVAPWWSNGLPLGFCRSPCLLAFTRMFTSSLFTAVFRWANTKEAEQSFCSSDKKRNFNVGNQLAGWCFF